MYCKSFYLGCTFSLANLHFLRTSKAANIQWPKANGDKKNL